MNLDELYITFCEINDNLLKIYEGTQTIKLFLLILQSLEKVITAISFSSWQESLCRSTQFCFENSVVNCSLVTMKLINRCFKISCIEQTNIHDCIFECIFLINNCNITVLYRYLISRRLLWRCKCSKML